MYLLLYTFDLFVHVCVKGWKEVEASVLIKIQCSSGTKSPALKCVLFSMTLPLPQG